MEMPPKTKKEPEAFLGIINSLSEFPPSTSDICESLRQLTSVKQELTWNMTYQKLFEDACMRFYDETKPLYLETDTSAVGLGAGLLQAKSSTSCPTDEAPANSILRPIAFTSKSPIEHRTNSNKEREAQYGLERFPNYFLSRVVSLTTYHKPLVAIFKKDVATPPQKLQ